MIEMHEAGTAAVSELSLGRCPALSGLPESVVRYLEERSQRKDMPAGKVIISADDPAHDVYVVLKGAVRVFRNAPIRHHNVIWASSVWENYSASSVRSTAKPYAVVSGAISML